MNVLTPPPFFLAPLCSQSARARPRCAPKKVEALVEEDEDLDDQLAIDADSLAAKGDDITGLLQKNEEVTAEREALAALIAETRRKLEEKKYRARIAARQERVCKASHMHGGSTKYSAVRYTMYK